MSVSNYTPGNGCSYSYSKLRDRIYLVSEDHVKRIYIDNGEAYISGLTETPLVIEGFNIDFKEESSLDERYKFQKTLTISKKGYASFKDFQGKYYAIIETIDGTFYMINVDFPSKITHVFNLSKDTNQTDFTFTSLSNYPTLRINYDFGSVPYVCKGFNVSGIKGLKLCERIRTEMSSVNSTIYTYGDSTGVNERSFRTIDYLGESCTFQEAYDGVNVTDTITFDIGFDAYKTSWQYNLLEFVENLYSAIIESNGEEDVRYYSGFNHGLEPSYSIAANNGDKQSDIITITLVEASNSGLFRVDEMTVTNDNSKSWRYIRKYGNHKTYECLEPGVGLYLVQEEVWANGTPTGRYKVMDGYEDEFYYLNIVGTFDDEVTFYQPECSCGSRPMYQWETLSIDSDYDCDSAATKYYKEAQVVSYDCGETWEETGQYRRGDVYETGSTDCGYMERWENIPIIEDYWCDECPEPTSYKWLAKYTGGTTSSAACDATSAIISGEVPSRSAVTSLEIGTCVRNIGNDAMVSATSLVNVTIPNSVTSIGEWAFGYCSSLTSIIIPNSVTNITNHTFAHCASLTSVTIPNSITSIGWESFSDCSNLANITIPNSVTSIGDFAFADCSSLTSVNVPNSVTNIEMGAFNHCTSLTSVTIPNSITTLSDGIFSYCSSLSSVTIPNSVTSIESGAFNYNPSLIEITIPDSVISMEGFVFQNCIGLTSATIGSSVRTIGNAAFTNCSGLTGVTINAVAPPTLGTNVFNNTNNCPIYVPCVSADAYKSAAGWSAYASRIQGVPPCEAEPKFIATYSDSHTSSAACDATSAITSGEVPSRSAVTSIQIADCVNEIGYGLFSGSTALRSVTMPNSITRIGGYAFKNCGGLSSIVIPSSVEYIQNSAFYGCQGANSITVEATTPPYLGSDVFTYTYGPIYVPAASVEAYKSHSTWSSYKSRIQAIS